ncbi:MAG: diaminobutyrate--2-oxoglutarate transaminase [Roseiarcus sp.]
MTPESLHSNKSSSQAAGAVSPPVKGSLPSVQQFIGKAELPATPSGFRPRPFYPTFGNKYLDRQATMESNARTYPRRLPLALESGRGIRVLDVEGREYIDCLSGAGALALGHNHAVVIEALQKALKEDIPFQTLDLPTPRRDRFVSDLFESLPASFEEQFKIQFCGPSGADAIEAALKLVKTATGRRGLLAFHGAYHGMTLGALSVSGDSVPKAAISGLSAEVQFLPFPSDYHCPFQVGGEAGADLGLRYIKSMLDDPNSGVLLPAGMILEIVQGEGGVNSAPDDWLREIRRLTEQRGVPLIVDEVQTGLGRTGCLYAFEHAGVTPDVLVLSKAIGGGLPLSVVLYRRDLDVWRPGAHAGTFRGNQLAFASGSATIRYVREQRLERNAAEMGRYMRSSFEDVAQEERCIGDVRGRGLMIGVEIVDKDANPTGVDLARRSSIVAHAIQYECLRRGLIVELGGRNGAVVRFLPPLIVTRSDVDAIVDRFRDAARAVGESLVA